MEKKITITITEYKYRFEVWSEAFCFGVYKRTLGDQIRREEKLEFAKKLLTYWGHTVVIKRIKAEPGVFEKRIPNPKKKKVTLDLPG